MHLVSLFCKFWFTNEDKLSYRYTDIWDAGYPWHGIIPKLSVMILVRSLMNFETEKTKGVIVYNISNGVLVRKHAEGDL